MRPPPDDFVTLIEQASIKEVLETPPNTFDIALMVGDVRFIEINPKSETTRQFLPLLHVTPNTLLAFLDEGFLTKRFDLFLAMNPHLFADFNFHWQTVGVPPRFAFTSEAAHGFVSRKNILDAASQAVPRVRESIGCRRPLVEDE